MQGVGFSLWISPEGEERRRLAALIASLARRFGGPVFDPHVTLLAGVSGPAPEVVARAERVAHARKALPLRLVGPEIGEGYFRCLYLRVEPSPELLALHAAAQAAFGREGEPPFFPHLSLMYGAPPLPPVVDDVRSRAPNAFEARSLDVYATEGEVERWHRLRALPFR